MTTEDVQHCKCVLLVSYYLYLNVDTDVACVSVHWHAAMATLRAESPASSVSRQEFCFGDLE